MVPGTKRREKTGIRQQIPCQRHPEHPLRCKRQEGICLQPGTSQVPGFRKLTDLEAALVLEALAGALGKPREPLPLLAASPPLLFLSFQAQRWAVTSLSSKRKQLAPDVQNH